MKKGTAIILTACSTTVFLMLGVTLWLLSVTIKQPFQDYSGEARILVTSGLNATDISQMLEQSGIIKSSLFFRWYLIYQGSNYFLQVGEYRFSTPLTITEVASKLHRGEVYRHKITLPEGLSLQEIAKRLEEKGFGDANRYQTLASVPDLISDLDPEADNLEGYLFPETYFFTFGMNEEAILKALTNRFRSIWNAERQTLAKHLGLTIREIISLASLIEKETAIPSERTLISSVFYNRIQKNMKLECDPTVIYAIKQVKEYDGVINQSDLKIDSLYNTYKYKGLPPGPITNPGADSIDAALKPDSSPYLYFVSKNDGSHFFSSRYRDHRKAVRVYQR